jgi:hypothetical protein
MYRRGGRSQVTMRRAGCVPAASKAETAEHGRWRTQNMGYEAMSEHYNESTLEDRIYITLLCMKGMDLQIFQWVIFLLFFYAFVFRRIHGVQGRGVLLLFERGGLKNDFARKGGWILGSCNSHPSGTSSRYLVK